MPSWSLKDSDLKISMKKREYSMEVRKPDNEVVTFWSFEYIV